MKLELIARELDLSIAGDKTFEVSKLSFADRAFENDLAIVTSQRDLKITKARSILSEPRFFDADKIFYIVDIKSSSRHL